MGLQSFPQILTNAIVDGPTLTAAAAATCIPANNKLTLPNNYFYIGKMLRITASGRISSVITTPGTARFDVRIGGVIAFDSLAILLDTVVIYRGPILIGNTTATITTALFGDSSGAPTAISGQVVAARAQDADDKWHIVIECNNLDGSSPPKPIFPLGYRFDSDDTTISFT